jgi:thiamine biosynthesis lipoprotein
MGTDCRIVAADVDLARHGADLVAHLERTWSRFDDASEVSALNRAGGRLTIVSSETFTLVDLAERARRATLGRFDPLLLAQLVAAGYDRTWSEVDRDDGRPPDPTVPATGESIELFSQISAVRLPDGTRFDPGGIGKGVAADMVADALRAAGSATVQVELGGDVRLAGPAWDGGPWRVRVDDSDHGAPQAAVIELAEGAVATSSVLRRRWRRGGIAMHHLIDPSTGVPATTDLDAVTTVAPTAWWAEVVAKVALMGGSQVARRLLADHDMAGVLVSSSPACGVGYDVIERVAA